MSETTSGLDEIDVEQLPPAPDDFEPCESDELPHGFGFISPVQQLATWLPAAFAKWGVPYRTVSGWQTRGRPPSMGGFQPRGILIHHTGTTSSASNPAPALGVVTNGRSDLAGPLCQISTGYDGVTTIVAAGRANHAGRSKAVGDVPAGDGNELWLGNEVQTNGTQRMPAVQYAAVVRSAAAVLDHFGADAQHAALHATTSYDGKWDLGAGDGVGGHVFQLATLRRDVAALLDAGPTGGFLMALTDAQQAELLELARATKARLYGVYPQRYMRRDPNDPSGRRWVRCAPTDEGAQPAPGLDSLDGNTIMLNIDAVRALLGGLSDVQALAKAIAEQVNAGGSSVSADAIVDAIAQRLAADQPDSTPTP